MLKSEDGKTFDLRIASQGVDLAKTPYVKSYSLDDGITVNVTAGDFSKFMTLVTESMEQAKHYAADQN